MSNRLEGNTVVDGELSANSLVSGTASLTNAMFSSAVGNRLDHEKVIGQFPVGCKQANGAAIASRTEHLHTARGSGEFIELLSVTTGVAPTGGDSVTIDIQKSVGGAAFATVLTAPVVLNSGNTVRVTEDYSSFSATTYAAGDVIIAVITVSGTSAQGLGVTLVLAEQPT
jgi:hypothetical protein